MLRRLVLALLLANGGYLVWSQGWLASTLGPWAAPQDQREPERLAQQLKPERMQLAGSSATPPSPAPVNPAPPESPPPAEAAETAVPDTQAQAKAEPTACWQVGVFNEKQLALLKPALDKALPEGSWVLESSTQPARWIVYTGKLANAEALAARRAELRQMKVEFRELNTPALQPGLALGTYSTEAAAQQALRDVTKAGVKGARAVIERPETTLYMARLPLATEAQKAAAAQAMAKVPGNPWPGKNLQVCP